MHEQRNIDNPLLGPFDGWSASDMLNALFNESLTPLTSSKGWAELLLRGAAEPLTQQQQEIVEKIQANIDRVLMVRQELLEEYRRRAGIR
jgi:signal transduction histidine kinase